MGNTDFNEFRVVGGSGADKEIVKIKANKKISIHGDLTVDSGITTFSQNVTFSKTVAVMGDLAVGLACQIGSTLQVGSAALFESSIDLDGYLKVKGATTLQDTLTVSKKGTFKRIGDSKDGFVLEGNPSGGKLLYVYHNSGATLDAVNYTGKDTSNDNIMNRQGISTLIDNKVAAANPANATQSTRGITYLGQANTGTSTSPTLKKGQLYFNSNNNTLIIGT